MELHASRTNLNQILGVPGKQLRIPPYQRPYAWGDEQVDELWEDLINALGSSHFMGSLVLTGDDLTPDVIDGQQRITTLLVLLSLVRDRWIHLHPATVGKVQQYLMSPYADGDARFKLRSGDANWNVLRRYALVPPDSPEHRRWENFEATEDAVTKARNGSLVGNARRLAERLDGWLGAKDERLRSEALASLERTILTGLEFVVIRVPEVADAFVIFETLNDRGLALSAGDLLKNHLLQQAARVKEDIQDLADRWDDLLGLLQGGDVTRFLRHYLLIRHSRVQKDAVFGLFKRDVAEQGAQRLMVELTNMARWYGEFVEPGTATDPSVAAVLGDLATLRASMCYSTLLAARRFHPVVSTEEFVSLARLAEFLTFRYSTICGKDSKDLERAYHRAAKVLWESEGKDLVGAREILAQQMPTRDEFFAAFEWQAMGRKYVIDYVLRKIEDHLEPEEKKTGGSRHVHIEHIMPQTLSEEWARSLGGRVGEHAEYVNRWGNLTLLGGRRNSSASNLPFERKKSIYETSTIVLTKQLCASPDWDLAAIVHRQRSLAELADRVWSPPA